MSPCLVSPALNSPLFTYWAVGFCYGSPAFAGRVHGDSRQTVRTARAAVQVAERHVSLVGACDTVWQGRWMEDGRCLGAGSASALLPALTSTAGVRDRP